MSNRRLGGRGDPDWAIRNRAFSALERLTLRCGGLIPWREIARGFEFRGQHMYFASPPIGIFKPRQMSAALSIKTVMPRAGRKAQYRDQEFRGDDPTGLASYDLAKGGPDNASNRHLHLAFERGVPLVYFRAIDYGAYEAIWPVWIEHFSFQEGRVLLAAQDPVRGAVSSVRAAEPVRTSPVRAARYVPGRASQRNRHAWFSSRTKSAYGYRCAFSGLPLRELLVGTRIVPDSDGGPAAVTNGICMSTLHDTAFRNHLIGVDPDLRVHVASSVIKGRDGPLLTSLQGLDGTVLREPDIPRTRPDPDYLAQRFRQFREAAGR